MILDIVFYCKEYEVMQCKSSFVEFFNFVIFFGGNFRVYFYLRNILYLLLNYYREFYLDIEFDVVFDVFQGLL